MVSDEEYGISALSEAFRSRDIHVQSKYFIATRNDHVKLPDTVIKTRI